MVDLDAFDANAADLVRRAGGTPIRVATKSLRVPALVSPRPGRPRVRRGARLRPARGALAVEQGLTDDVVMGYPTVDGVGAAAR